jgi:hypothetical protein
MFVMELYHGLSFKMPINDRCSFKQRVAARYPSLEVEDQQNKGAQYYSEVGVSYLPSTLPFPESPKEIQIFTEFIVQEAIRKSPERTEQRYAHLCSNAEDKYFGMTIKRRVFSDKRDERNPPTTVNTTKTTTTSAVSSTPATITSTAAIESNKNDRSESRDNRKPLFCNHCKGTTHLIETCFQLHPELKEKHKEKLQAKRQRQKDNKSTGKNEGNAKCSDPKDPNVTFNGKQVRFTTNSIKQQSDVQPTTDKKDF